MTKKIKFLFGTLVLSLGFLFCFCFASLSVNAEEVDNTTEEPKVEETQPEDQEETTEKTEFDVDSFLAHLKDFKWQEAEAVIGWVIAYLVVKFGIDAGVAIGLILIYLRKFKDSNAYKALIVRQNADSNAKREEDYDKFIELLEEQKKEINDTLTEYKKKLEELSNDKTKEIEADIKAVKEDLK